MNTNESSEHAKPPFPGVVCPCEAHGPLVFSGEENVATCSVCGRSFSSADNIWDFNLGERFADEKCECMWCNEEKTGRHLVEHYLHPLIHQTRPDCIPAALKILSIGCGVGSDVERLNELGYYAVGIDAGNRSEFWNRRQWPERYYLANAKYLPFDDEYFDIVLMGCVLPHIGVGDDTYETVPGYEAERQLAADEMIRVTKKGGFMVVSSPNRLCPIDFFHRGDVRKHIPRIHSMAETFLLSVADYKRLLKVGEKCRNLEVLPLRAYWGFYSSSRYFLGRLLQIPVRWYFNYFMSWSITKNIRGSVFNPWLILKIQR